MTIWNVSFAQGFGATGTIKAIKWESGSNTNLVLSERADRASQWLSDLDFIKFSIAWVLIGMIGPNLTNRSGFGSRVPIFVSAKIRSFDYSFGKLHFLCLHTHHFFQFRVTNLSVFTSQKSSRMIWIGWQESFLAESVYQFAAAKLTFNLSHLPGNTVPRDSLMSR